MAKFRAAVITDIHNGPDSGAKLGSKAPRLLESFAKAVSQYRPDSVIDLGDRITASNAADAAARMQGVCAVFNRLAAPVYSVLGNHDLKYLSRTANEAITGSPSENYFRDHDHVRLVFFNPRAIARRRKRRIGSDEQDWLRDVLKHSPHPVIVFSHVPLDNLPQDEAGAKTLNQGRKGYASAFTYPDGPQVREILEQSGKVILCMSGHLHRNRCREINGIPYVTQQALVRTHRKKYRVPTGTWSKLELDDAGGVSVALQGKYRKTYNFSSP